MLVMWNPAPNGVGRLVIALGIRGYRELTHAMMWLGMALVGMGIANIMTGMMIVVMIGFVSCMHGYGYYLFVGAGPTPMMGKLVDVL